MAVGGVRVERFRAWWKVSWVEDKRPFELVFRTQSAARKYADALVRDLPLEALREMERNRLQGGS
jgi:hypothetical protein